MPRRSLTIQNGLDTTIQHFRSAMLAQEVDMDYTEAIQILAEAGANVYMWETPGATAQHHLKSGHLAKIKHDLENLRVARRNT